MRQLRPAAADQARVMPPFDHEKLDVYRLAVEFVAWAGEVIDAQRALGPRLSALKHLDEASQSISNNIAEGNGKRSMPDRCHYLDIARGSALECAACIDGLVARKRLARDVAESGKAILTRIVSMLSKLVARLSAH
jgi:four helix bundle protein